MKARHTPGPWTYRFRKAGTIVETEAGKSIAHVRDTPGVGDFDANARLIAQAPAMLAALQRILSECEAGKHDAGTAGMSDARAVISLGSVDGLKGGL